MIRDRRSEARPYWKTQADVPDAESSGERMSGRQVGGKSCNICGVPFLRRLRSMIGLTISGTANNGRVIPKPEQLDELVRIANEEPEQFFELMVAMLPRPRTRIAVVPGDETLIFCV